jgi:Subunit ChlI of Mg-chelatase
VQANGTALGAILGEHSTASRTHQALFKARSAAVYGIDAHLIDVEVDFSQIKLGKEIVITVGLPDAAMRESRDRVKSAIRNRALRFLRRRSRSTFLLRT